MSFTAGVFGLRDNCRFCYRNSTRRYGHVAYEPEINDSIKFIGEQAAVEVKLNWNPIPGSINVKSTISNHQTYGTMLEGSITVESTFSVDEIELIDVLYNMDLNKTNEIENNIVLKADQEYIVSYISTMLDNNFKLVKNFFTQIKSTDSYQKQNEIWEKNWPEGMNISLDLTFNFKDDYYYIYKIPIRIGYSSFPRSTIDFTTIYTDEIFSKQTKITNFFNIPVEFTLHDPLQYSKDSYSIKYKRHAIVQPHDSFDVVVTLECYKPDIYTIEIPVTTNISPPFIIPVTVTVEIPKVRFTNSTGEMVTEVSFNDGSDPKYMQNKWKQCINMFINDDSELSLKNFHITNNNFLSCSMNTTTFKQNQTVELCFDLSLWLYESDDDISNLEFSLSALNFLYVLPIKINLSKEAKINIIKSLDQTINIFSLVSIFPLFFNILLTLFCYLWFNSELKWKKERIERAIKHFSVNQLKTAGIQQNEDNYNIYTQWIYNDNEKFLGPASKDACELMEHMIN